MLRIKSNNYNTLIRLSGGETGIRTLGTRKGSTVFETAPFDHSGTSPRSETGRFSGAITKVGSGRVQEEKCTIYMHMLLGPFVVDISLQLKDNARLLQEGIPVAYLCNCPKRGTQSEVQILCETPRKRDHTTRLMKECAYVRGYKNWWQTV